MAQTETQPGSRVPWTAEDTEADRPEDDAHATVAPPDEPTTIEERVTTDMIEPTTAAPARKPTKFMADLSRAMQTAAEASRDETMVRFLADAKTVVEEIQSASTGEAADLRRRADDDVAAIREWSKAEIARIRDETETRIATRKTALDGEIDAFGQVVEERVQRVGARVETFQAEMDAFFARLMAEGDPTRIATMAETMPDPPDLAEVAASVVGPSVEPIEPFGIGLATIPPDPTPDPLAAESPTADAAQAEGTPEPGTGDLEAEAQAALAARLEFAAAEAEALAFTGDMDEDGPATAAPGPNVDSAPAGALVVGLAQADAGTLPPLSNVEVARTTTRVVVVGLVSVASIATFKRSIGRTEGVSAVSVASGPDGEFIFSVDHDATMGIGEAIAALPGFDARITAESAGTLEVTAHDPDTGL